jgi:hypothetical protein
VSVRTAGAASAGGGGGVTAGTPPAKIPASQIENALHKASNKEAVRFITTPLQKYLEEAFKI